MNGGSCPPPPYSPSKPAVQKAKKRKIKNANIVAGKILLKKARGKKNP